ncbi:MAG: Cgl0159 family (beta/alpha)8-fold protein [Bacillota bacterium]
MTPAFTPGSFLPDSLFDRLTDLRVKEPGRIAAEAQARRRRPNLTEDGKLVILAADHPARNVVRGGSDPLGMGDRRAYLERIVRVISHPEVDGIMATPDIIDELFLINYLVRQAGGAPFLDGKVLMGCINRGGLAGAIWELDDFLTGYTPERIAALGLDAAKLMFRLNLQEPDSAKTVRYCAEWVTELNRLGVPSFLEALSVSFENGAWRMRLETEEMVRVVGVASGLGDSTANTWLKLPMVPDFRRVARATTLPILVLGGESHGEPLRTVGQIAEVMQAGSNVRGALVGRNVVWPGPHDPQAVAVAVARVVRGSSVAEAAAAMEAAEGQGLGALRSLLEGRE